eukprot:276894-Rhodomonas_salina.3
MIQGHVVVTWWSRSGHVAVTGAENTDWLEAPLYGHAPSTAFVNAMAGTPARLRAPGTALPYCPTSVSLHLLGTADSGRCARGVWY